ncbi:hypothetical protein GFY24_37465 [Nocardia sp. SYP-A9097]|uniref:hypothetical protein n=1 Tax=Nocardia sp. SYP-A9097 TaxID=2663237 RepID=UPI00129A8AF2|nr:hypothetical protein [Nocardia sp. SYP-A9097]MRH93047.1 hypothetical protein [Nocardia sp. SYP-A9097]
MKANSVPAPQTSQGSRRFSAAALKPVLRVNFELGTCGGNRYRGECEGLAGLSYACQELCVMTKNPRARQARSRTPESPELVARLQRSRQRSLQRRAAATEREKTITRAVGKYLAAWNAITNAEQRRDSEVERLREQIDTVIARASTEIGGYENAQAAAAAAVRAHVQADEEVADLLEITLKRARQLLGGSRARTPAQSRGRASSNSADPTHLLTTIAPAHPRPGGGNPVATSNIRSTA